MSKQSFRLWVSCFIILMIHTHLFAQKTDKKLDKALHSVADNFHGKIGWHIINLKNNKVSSHQADTIFPTASIIKVPILTGIMQKIASGELQYHQKLVYKDSLLYAGEDILGSFKSDETIELGKVVMLMLTTSDNTASLWLQSLAGTGTTINNIMQQIGLQHTRVNSRTTGRQPDWQLFGWGQTTPREMATLFQMISTGKIISQEISDKMLKLLSRNYWDEHALNAIPAGVFVASKNGAVDASRSEVLYVNAKGTPYIFSVFTQQNEDKRWDSNNEAWQLTERMSNIVWQHFNGK